MTQDLLENKKIYPRVIDFYNGKSVLITGATGFVGIVLTETLLRCCLGIKAIYAVVRPKKGKTPKQRLAEMLSKSVFNPIKDHHPELLKKVHVVEGEVTKPYLGINADDLKNICDEVSIVFHCAASISFTKPLRFLLVNNVLSVQYVIDLCRKLKHMEILVYTSTQYSNSNRHGIVIGEKVYRLPFTTREVLDALKEENDIKINTMFSQSKPDWHNYYTFSKCLAENLIQDEAIDLTSAILRPSMIASVWKGPMPGYCEENSSLAQLTIGCGKGFVKVLLADPDVIMDLIPVDVVVNAHIIAPWRLATGRSSSPLVVNCTSRGQLDITFREYRDTLFEFATEHPVPKSFRSFTEIPIIKNIHLFRLVTFYEHYIPAYFLDLLLTLNGKKPRLVTLYKFFDTASFTAYPFMTRNWEYETKNLQRLEELDSEDKKLFYTDLTGLTFRDFAYDLADGAPVMNWKTDKRTKEERQKIIRKRHLLSKSVQYAVAFLFFWLLYKLVTMLI